MGGASSFYYILRFQSVENQGILPSIEIVKFVWSASENKVWYKTLWTWRRALDWQSSMQTIKLLYITDDMESIGEMMQQIGSLSKKSIRLTENCA